MKKVILSFCGDIGNGIKVHGPFNNSEEAHSFNKKYILQSNLNYSLAEFEVEDIQYNDIQTLYTVAVGNPFDGIKFDKLTDDDGVLHELSAYEYKNQDWWVIQINRPENFIK